MPLRHPYVVWKARPVQWNTSEARGGDLRSPHGTLSFADGNGRHKIEINVRSRDTIDQRLIFWTGKLTNETQFGHQGPNNDITDDLDAFFQADSADFERSTLFVWGELIGHGSIHQVHLNQGNYSRNRDWYSENGRGQDGGIVMQSPDGMWKYFFIAFAGQASETDNNGNLASGDATVMLRDFINAPPPVTPSIPVTPGQASGL
ncbi:hypothetical protein BKA60DRAFT_628524 [Fusarium oxysporum]|uniref:Uncharacterized protein n=1 Tax=Fusarium oxysporum TaxID=5507 RepID=A0A420M824_FUSOX|nr:hypothetical protein BKA60DRAFT_628524 [Fusarium oxysporum]RKK57389.1 hypothetical protein BFJ69_g17527 [Fusarium oxysporum]